MTWLLADIVSVFITWTDLSLWDVRTGERPCGVWWTVLCIRTESEALLGVFCNCIVTCDCHVTITQTWRVLTSEWGMMTLFTWTSTTLTSCLISSSLSIDICTRGVREKREGTERQRKKFKITPVLKHSLTFSIFRSQSVSCSRALIDLSTSWRCSISAV